MRFASRADARLRSRAAAKLRPRLLVDGVEVPLSVFGTTNEQVRSAAPPPRTHS